MTTQVLRRSSLPEQRDYPAARRCYTMIALYRAVLVSSFAWGAGDAYVNSGTVALSLHTGTARGVVAYRCCTRQSRIRANGILKASAANDADKQFCDVSVVCAEAIAPSQSLTRRTFLRNMSVFVLAACTAASSTRTATASATDEAGAISDHGMIRGQSPLPFAPFAFYYRIEADQQLRSDKRMFNGRRRLVGVCTSPMTSHRVNGVSLSRCTSYLGCIRDCGHYR